MGAVNGWSQGAVAESFLGAKFKTERSGMGSSIIRESVMMLAIRSSAWMTRFWGIEGKRLGGGGLGARFTEQLAC